MRYTELVKFYDSIDTTSSRILMTSYLVDLFKKTPEKVIDKVVYLTEGKLYPAFVGIELGIAEKMILKALSTATGISQNKINDEYKKKGDIGTISEDLLKTRIQMTLFKRELDVEDVYEALDKIARISGTGSVDIKIKILSGLLTDASPKEAKYIIRTITGKMRLGIANMTIVDALSQAFANGRKEDVEAIYNISPDLGEIAKRLKSEGMECIKTYKADIGKPIRMMLAQRMNSIKETIGQMTRSICEYKYDGERIQIHKSGKKILLFSRNLENITLQYPDIVKLANNNIKVEEAIIEGECVAVDNTGYILPFQELMKRKRKHGIEESVEKFPINMYLFDILYLNKKDMMFKPLIERRNILRSSIEEKDGFRLSHATVVENTDEGIKNIDDFFESSIENSCEGLILKDPMSIYQAGIRGWSWVKIKKSYQSKMVEPIDVVIVGAFFGKGKRSGNYGALLVAVYDYDRNVFSTISKLGSGFTDGELEDLPNMLSSYVLEKKHHSVESILDVDVWFKPKIVIEVIGDEITLSPIHLCGRDRITKNTGLAIRFPRFTHNFRYDKNPEDATRVQEIIDMYNNQQNNQVDL